MLRWRDKYDLLRGVEGRVSSLLLQIAVAVAMVAAAGGLRLVIDSYFTDVTPFALIFPAVVFATLLAGSRSGLIVILLGQSIAWYYVVPVKHSFRFETAGNVVSMIITTIAELTLLWAISAFRVAAHRASELERDRVEGLELALRELTHRTKNNFQLAAALLTLHARRDKDGPVAKELHEAANRLISIAAAHDDRVVRGGHVSRVALDEYLRETCERLRNGLMRDGVVLHYQAEVVEVGHDCALQVGLIVNELVTNALKHAFRDRDGRIDVVLTADDAEIQVTVADDGPGMAMPVKVGGIGNELVSMLARRLDSRLTRLDRPGTAFLVAIPRKTRPA